MRRSVVSSAGKSCSELLSSCVSDTGYRSTPGGPVCPVFQGQSDSILGSATADGVAEIRERLGEPDLALLPIAPGAVLPFVEHLTGLRLNQHRLTASIHCSPRDAMDIHKEIGSRRSIGIHWGTFTTTIDARMTMSHLEESRKEMGVSDVWEKEGAFVVGEVGAWIGCWA